MTATPPAPPAAAAHASRRAAIVRGVAAFALWMVLMQSLKPGDLAAGAIAAFLAVWASLRLLPPRAGGLRFGALIALAPHFLRQSVVAGWDVARRVFDPRLPIRPGFLEYRPRIAPGAQRNAFAAYTSLLPGTVPAGDDGEVLLYHCLDIDQPVAAELAAEEAALARCSGTDSTRIANRGDS